MAASIDFTGPFLKTERAEHHIDHLKRLVTEHIKASKDALIPHRNRNRRKKPFGKPLPRHFPTILGDALHNLRASLDHAYCILIESHGQVPSAFSRFPFATGGDRKSFEGSINGQKQLPRPEIIDHIVNVIQPFKGGAGTDLMALHDLDIADKHIVLLPTAQHLKIEALHYEGFSISGTTFISRGDSTSNPIGGLPLKNDAKHKATLQICFGGGQPLEGQPVIETLRRIARTVDQTLNDLKAIGEK